MSELQPQPEFRSRSELRTREGAAPKIPGIARHGRLRKANPWPSILKFTAAALAVVLVSGASVGAIAFNSLDSQRETVTLLGDTQGPPPQIGAIEGGFNILIVGSDTRAGQGGIGGDEDEETSVLNDVNILLHVSQDQTNATVISFPRDMVVGIPECPDEEGDTKGYSTEPLNVALYYGGLPCVVLTLQELTGLPIQFAGMISFQGVIAMSDAIGGVDVCVDGPVIDPYSGIALPEAGPYNLAGAEALAFLRSRHGVGDGSDLTRISSQQVYLSSLVRTLKSSDTLGDYKKLYDLANAAIGSMVLSSSLADVPTLVSVALALKDIPTERVTFVQYPGRTGGEGIYAGKVQPNESKAAELMAIVAADQPFLLAEVGDGQGSQLDPNAPAAPAPDPSSTAVPVDNTGLPVVEGVRGQTAADYTCSISNSY
jgi:LCP family protein required for cell wall assembly